MLKKLPVIAAAAFHVLGASSVSGQSQARPQSWVVQLSTPVKTAGVDSQNKATTLAVSCSKKGFELAVLFNSGLAGWRTAEGDLLLRIGNRSYPVRISGSSESVFLSDRPDGGVSSELLSAIASRDPVVLEGGHVAQMAAQARTYPSTGAEAAMATLKAQCALR